MQKTRPDPIPRRTGVRRPCRGRSRAPAREGVTGIGHGAEDAHRRGPSGRRDDAPSRAGALASRRAGEASESRARPRARAAPASHRAGLDRPAPHGARLSPRVPAGAALDARGGEAVAKAGRRGGCAGPGRHPAPAPRAVRAVRALRRSDRGTGMGAVAPVRPRARRSLRGADDLARGPGPAGGRERAGGRAQPAARAGPQGNELARLPAGRQASCRFRTAAERRRPERAALRAASPDRDRGGGRGARAGSGGVRLEDLGGAGLARGRRA
jgi:hypothetical protein